MTDSEVQVRRAVPEDAPAVRELLSQLGYDLPLDEVTERLGNAPNEAVLVAETSGFVVGLVSVSVRLILHLAEPRAAIDTLAVNEATRSQGVGHLLVEAAIRFALDRWATTIEVHSNLRRTDAHRFYERHGFVHTSQFFVASLTKSPGEPEP